MATAASPASTFSSRRFQLGAALTVVLVGLLVWVMVRGDGNERREAVGGYVLAVNDVERRLSTEIRGLGDAYQGLRLDAKAPAGQLADLARAKETIAGLHDRIGALVPPPEAERLHAGLLKLLDLEVAFAGDVRDLARALPDLARERTAFAKAAQRLRTDLGGAKTVAAQIRAFRRFGTGTTAVARGLAGLEMPPVLEPSRAAEEKRMRTLARLSGRVRRALAAGRSDEAVRLSQFLARLASATGATRPERKAFEAYNARLAAIGKAAKSVRDELTRLNGVL